MRDFLSASFGNNYRLNWEPQKNTLYFGPYFSDFSLAVKQIELLKFEFNKLAGRLKTRKICFNLIRKSPTRFNVELMTNNHLVDIAYNIDEFNLWRFYSLLKRNCHVVLTVFYDDIYTRRTECLAITERLGITIR